MFIRRLIYILTLMCVSVLLSVPSQAQTIIYVNHAALGADNGTSWTDAYTFLQDALQAVQSGDEVWVAAGIYRPDQGDGIVQGDREATFDISSGVEIYGGFVGIESSRADRDWHVNETILSGDLNGDDNENIAVDEPTRSDNSHHVANIGNVSESAVLDGFLIQSGHASDPSSGFTGAGGGILIQGPAVVRNLILRRNIAGDGGGAYVATAASEPVVIEFVQFIENKAKGGIGGSGGALYSGSPGATYRHLTFKNNSGVNGGGIFVDQNLRLYDATFEHNSALEGGGVYLQEARSLHLVNTIFNANEAASGGGIYAEETQPNNHRSVLITNTIIINNLAERGGAVFSDHVTMQIINSTIVDNYGSVSGGGIYHNVVGSSINIFNSILWGNLGNDIPNQYYPFFHPGLPGGTDLSTIHSSLVQGGVPEGMMDDGLTDDLDPLFVDPDGPDNISGTIDDDFRLLIVSPAIDAGANSSLPADSLDLDQDGLLWEGLPVDLDMNVRVFDGGSGTATVDIGAYEYGAPPVVLVNDRVADVLPETVMLLGNYPNPFNPSTTITYALPHPTEIRIEVFDLLGKRVRLLESGFKPSGEHEVTLDATGLPSGVYFYTLTSGDFTQTRKMVVVK